jgi:hypothetical protein
LFSARCCSTVSLVTNTDDFPVTILSDDTPLPLTPSREHVLPVDIEGAALNVLPTCLMTGSTPRCTLDFGAVQYSGPVNSFTTRGYQQTDVLTGPTIRVPAGITFQIQINNLLSSDNNDPAGTNMNIPHLPNSTNIHTV